MELLGNVKTYEWGKIGRTSKVAQLAALNDSNFKIDVTTPYSELWIGDHVSGPSLLKDGGSFVHFTKTNPKAIGGMQSLPFLLKVLSIKKALSLQVHPDKILAAELHKTFPDIYKDGNHKPELAIALTPFLALCGFRPYNEIAQVLRDYPEISTLIGDAAKSFTLSPSEEGLREVFTTVMQAPNIAPCITSLRTTCKESRDLYQETFLRLDSQFPEDVGCISMFFLNLVHLAPGEAINLEAKLPHAYIKGDCVECMACSDNVIRAGLTPKFKDVPMLLKCLDYTPKAQNEVKYQPRQVSPYLRAFVPKVDDFAVIEVKVPQGVEGFVLENRKFGSVLLVLEGAADIGGFHLDEGKILFLPATLGPEVKVTTKGPFTAYQAMFNDFEVEK